MARGRIWVRAMQYFDSIALAAVVAELNALGEARIDKVGQPTAYELYLIIRVGGRNHRLYINVRERWARMHLTERALGNVAVPFAFTMLLRKHLEGSRLLRIVQPGLERVAHLVVAGRDELGDPFERELVVELIGKYANMFLIENQGTGQGTGRILGCLRTVTEEMCQARQLGVGLPYDPPPINMTKIPFLAATDDDLARLANIGAVKKQLPPIGNRDSQAPGPPGGPHGKLFMGRPIDAPGRLVDRLSTGLAGVGKVAIAQLIAGEGPDAAGLAAVFARAREALLAGRFYPRLEKAAGWDYAMWWLDPAVPPPTGPGVSEMLDGYYDALAQADALADRRRRLAGAIAALVGKQRERLAGWEAGLAKAEGAERHRELGDLITSHMHAVVPGSDRLEVTDFFREGALPLTIPMDPRLTGSENAQVHFKRYRKARNGRLAIEGLLVAGRLELGYLEQVALAVDQADTLPDLGEIADELAVLAAEGPKSQLRREKKPLGRRKGASTPVPSPTPLRVQSGDGFTIYVGKNNKQNEHVTFKLARSHDWWLHAQNIPGSHVVIALDEASARSGEVPENTLHEAAMLAAYFSQARDSSRVPVVFTRRKHVRKPHGGRPGMVLYEQEKTLFVTPDGAAIATLLGRD